VKLGIPRPCALPTVTIVSFETIEWGHLQPLPRALIAHRTWHVKLRPAGSAPRNSNDLLEAP
jgi:hypothetical protein